MVPDQFAGWKANVRPSLIREGEEDLLHDYWDLKLKIEDLIWESLELRV